LPFEALAKEGEGEAGRDFQIETPYIPRRPFSTYHPRPPKMNLEICQDNLPATWKYVKSAPGRGNYPEKCFYYFLRFRGCPIYRAFLKTADPAQ
jgi:hypothetical protein